MTQIKTPAVSGQGRRPAPGAVSAHPLRLTAAAAALSSQRMTDAYFVYVTVGGEDEARAIARALVGERLAAGANLVPGLRSIYRWRGEVREAVEVALVLKTRAALVDRVIARVKALHGYECPCVVAWPIAAGNPAYLDWIAAETISGD